MVPSAVIAESDQPFHRMSLPFDCLNFDRSTSVALRISAARAVSLSQFVKSYFE